MDIERQVPVAPGRRRFFPFADRQPLEDNPWVLHYLKVAYLVFAGFSLAMSFTLMFAYIPKRSCNAILFVNFGLGFVIYVIVWWSDTIPLIPLCIGPVKLPIVESLLLLNITVSTISIGNRSLREEGFKPVFSLQSMCLEISLAFYAARLQEWLRLVPPDQLPGGAAAAPPQNAGDVGPADDGAALVPPNEAADRPQNAGDVGPADNDAALVPHDQLPGEAVVPPPNAADVARDDDDDAAPDDDDDAVPAAA